jgi:exopolyphosphatase/pppGpp-phosphohydrolase
MSRTRQDLEAKLTKKWLSSNAVREGLITSLILTLQEHGELGDVEARVDRAAREEFQRYQVDEEYAPPDTLQKVLTAVERRLGFDTLPADVSGRHRETCDRLLAKVDQQSGYR